MHCPKCGKQTPLYKTACIHCGSDISRVSIDDLLADDNLDNLEQELDSISSERGLSIGDRIIDRFQVKVLIGRGSFGAVYRAQDLEVGDLAVVKVIHEKFFTGQDDSFKDKLIEQIRAVGETKHENIINLRHVCQDQGLVLVAYDHIVALPLAKLIEAKTRKGSHFEPDHILDIFSQINSALSQTAPGVFHGDLTPANILVRKDTIKIADFGIAAGLLPVIPIQIINTFTGKSYRPPEVFQTPEKADRRSDVYSLGAILYQMLTLEPMRSSEEFPPEFDEGQAASLKQVVQKAVMMDPQDRYPDSDSFFKALSAVIAPDLAAEPEQEVDQEEESEFFQEIQVADDDLEIEPVDVFGDVEPITPEPPAKDLFEEPEAEEEVAAEPPVEDLFEEPEAEEEVAAEPPAEDLIEEPEPPMEDLAEAPIEEIEPELSAEDAAEPEITVDLDEEITVGPPVEDLVEKLIEEEAEEDLEPEPDPESEEVAAELAELEPEFIPETSEADAAEEPGGQDEDFPDDMIDDSPLDTLPEEPEEDDSEADDETEEPAAEAQAEEPTEDIRAEDYDSEPETEQPEDEIEEPTDDEEQEDLPSEANDQSTPVAREHKPADEDIEKLQAALEAAEAPSEPAAEEETEKSPFLDVDEEAPPTAEEPPVKRNWVWPAAALVLLLVVAAGALAFYKFYGTSTDDHKVEIAHTVPEPEPVVPHEIAPELAQPEELPEIEPEADQPLIVPEPEPPTATEAPPTAPDEDARRITALIKRGDQYFQRNRLTSPTGENAYAMYFAALAIDSNSEQAIAGIKNIENQYLKYGDENLTKKNLERAEYNYLKALTINPKSWEAKNKLAEINRLRERQAPNELPTTPAPRTPAAPPAPPEEEVTSLEDISPEAPGQDETVSLENLDAAEDEGKVVTPPPELPKATPPEPPKEETPQGTIDIENVKTVIKSYMGRIKICYADGLVKNPDLKGEIKVQFTVGVNGRVTASKIASSTMNDPDVENCILRRFQRMTFPKPEGGEVTIKYPMIFKE